MTTKFSVINPMTGIYTDAATEQERDALLAKTAWEFFLAHTHNMPYSVVVVNEDGSETWSAPNGAPMLSPAELAAEAAAWEAQQTQP